MIKGQTVLAIVPPDMAAGATWSRYVDTVLYGGDPYAQQSHDWIVYLAGPASAADVDACIERAQLGHGCVSTTMGRPDGVIGVATREWLETHEFGHAGLCKYERPGA